MSRPLARKSFTKNWGEYIKTAHGAGSRQIKLLTGGSSGKNGETDNFTAAHVQTDHCTSNDGEIKESANRQ